MGLRIEQQAAEGKFWEALALAKSSSPLPEAWLAHTRRVGETKSLTFTPALGTALLAKATDRFIDVFSLREGTSHKSYSARSLAKEVFVPCCVRAGIDIRTTGAEPLNNQPFLRAEKISPELNVKANARPDLEYLCDCLKEADFLENTDAVHALAAFLRARLEATAAQKQVTVSGSLPLPDLLTAVDDFASGPSEGGKVGQALAAAILDLVFPDVRAKRINDPSMKWPGDVGVFDEGNLTLPVEVKQRPMTEEETLLFAQRLSKFGLGRGVALALEGFEPPSAETALCATSRQNFDVELFPVTRLSTLLSEAIRWTRADTHSALARFPGRGLARLKEIEVSPDRLEAWGSLFPGSE